MGIAIARQMVGRRGYPNDIRDNEQRSGISRDGNRKSKTDGGRREGEKAMRKGRKDICQTTGKGTTWVMIATNYGWRGKAASHGRARINTETRNILKKQKLLKIRPKVIENLMKLPICHSQKNRSYSNPKTVLISHLFE